MDAHLFRHLKRTNPAFYYRYGHDDFKDLGGWGVGGITFLSSCNKGSKVRGRRWVNLRQCRCEKGETGRAEKSVHTMYMAYTQSCAEYMRHKLRRTRHFRDGCWMGHSGDKEKPVHQQETVGQPASGVRKGGSTGGSDNMHEQI